MTVAEVEATEKPKRRAKATPESVTMTMTGEELERAIEKAADKIIKQTIKEKVGKVFSEEWDKVTVNNINATAKELIGKDFYEVILLSKQMCKGDGIWSIKDIAIAMQRLGGYHATIATAAAILEGQYAEAYSENFMNAKKTSQTDGTAQQIATFACSEINSRRLIFRSLRESIIEQINILKKLFEAERDERRFVTPTSPG